MLILPESSTGAIEYQRLVLVLSSSATLFCCFPFRLSRLSSISAMQSSSHHKMRKKRFRVASSTLRLFLYCQLIRFIIGCESVLKSVVLFSLSFVRNT